MTTTYTRQKLEFTLRRVFPTSFDGGEISEWSVDDLTRMAMRAAAFTHAGVIELNESTEMIVRAAVRDVATFGALRFEDPLADLTPRQAALHLAQEFYRRLIGSLDVTCQADWLVAMHDRRPQSWFVKRKFEHVVDGQSMKGELIVWFDSQEKTVTSLAFLPGDGRSFTLDKRDLGIILKHEVYDPFVEDAPIVDRFEGVPAFSLAMAVADGAFRAATEDLLQIGRENWVVEDDRNAIELACLFTLLVRDGAEMRRDQVVFVVVFDPEKRELMSAGFKDGDGPSRWLDRDERQAVVDQIRL
jgi:hypothetical protein